MKRKPWQYKRDWYIARRNAKGIIMRAEQMIADGEELSELNQILYYTSKFFLTNWPKGGKKGAKKR